MDYICKPELILNRKYGANQWREICEYLSESSELCRNRTTNDSDKIRGLNAIWVQKIHVEFML
jgi:hypothetical protein